MLQPPGGGSSNIFGGPEPTPQQQVKKEQEKPVEPSQQGEQANPTADAQGEYQKNKPKARGIYTYTNIHSPTSLLVLAANIIFCFLILNLKDVTIS